MLRIWAWIIDSIPSVPSEKTTIIICILAFVAMVGVMTIKNVVSAQEDTIVNVTLGDVPPCQEDEIVVGMGDFNSDGYWSKYRCDHPDTLLCQTFYHFLELRISYIDNGPLTEEQIKMVDELNTWYSCGFE